MARMEDRRVRRTKRLLRQALAELMQEKDFKDITVTDLVERADINRGTFYMHYRDVYDLREQIENEMIKACGELIGDAEAAAMNDTLHAVLMRATDYLLENRQIVCGLLRTTGEDNFGSKMIAVMERHHMLGAPSSKRLRDVYTARFVGAGVVAVMQKWLLGENEMSQEEVVQLMDDLLRRCLHTRSPVS